MPIAIRTTVHAESTQAFLRDLAGRIGDVGPALRGFGRVMLRSISENFEQEGRPLAWKPLAQATRDARRHGTGSVNRPREHSILSNTGLLKGGMRYLVEGNVLRVGTSGPANVYARIHQLGGQAGRGHAVTIPARPYLLFQHEDLTEAEELLRRYVEGRGRA